MEEAGCGQKHEGWFEQGRCTLSINVDSHWVEVNPATLTCWGCYHILDIGLTKFATSLLLDPTVRLSSSMLSSFSSVEFYLLSFFWDIDK